MSELVAGSAVTETGFSKSGDLEPAPPPPLLALTGPDEELLPRPPIGEPIDPPKLELEP